MEAKQKEAMKAKFEQAGLGFESISVFGAIRCNVHVRCVGRDTAHKWAQLFGQVFKGARVSLTETMWDAAQNKGTVLNATKRKGFLIAVAA